MSHHREEEKGVQILISHHQEKGAQILISPLLGGKKGVLILISHRQEEIKGVQILISPLPGEEKGVQILISHHQEKIKVSMTDENESHVLIPLLVMFLRKLPKLLLELQLVYPQPIR